MTAPASFAYENPFCAARLRPGTIEYLFPSGVCLADLIARLAACGWRGEIVGPHGAGKSTLLTMLLDELRRQGRVIHNTTLHDGQRKLSPLFWKNFWNSGAGPAADRAHSILANEPREIVAIDGFEQLSRWNRWSLRSFCRCRSLGLIVTSHAPGGLPALYETQVEPDLAWQVAERLQDGRPSLVDRADLTRQLQRHGSNLREALFALYDIYESRLRRS